MNTFTNNPNSSTHKFLVIGSPVCGKTTILDYYCNPEQKARKVKKTVGCDIHVKELPMETNEVKSEDFVEFWDLSGDIQHHPHLKVYTHAQQDNIDAFKGIIFFFDMNNIYTLWNMNKFLKELIPTIKGNAFESSKASQEHKMPFLIVGNKFDLISEDERQSKCETIKEYLDSIFDFDPRLQYTFISKESPIEDFKDIDTFIENCVSGKLEELYMLDITQELQPYDKYRNYKKKTLELLGKDLRRVQRFVSATPFHLYMMSAALMLMVSTVAVV